jgi:hypothetical protein
LAALPTADQALLYVMTKEMRAFGLPIPSDLAAVESWSIERSNNRHPDEKKEDDYRISDGKELSILQLGRATPCTVYALAGRLA